MQRSAQAQPQCRADSINGVQSEAHRAPHDGQQPMRPEELRKTTVRVAQPPLSVAKLEASAAQAEGSKPLSPTDGCDCVAEAGTKVKKEQRE